MPPTAPPPGNGSTSSFPKPPPPSPPPPPPPAPPPGNGSTSSCAKPPPRSPRHRPQKSTVCSACLVVPTSELRSPISHLRPSRIPHHALRGCQSSIALQICARTQDGLRTTITFESPANTHTGTPSDAHHARRGGGASMSKSVLFVSSVQKELQAERRAVKDYIEGDALLRRFFHVFLFEDLPASGRRAGDVYLAEVEHCAIYLGLFGNEYGHPDTDGFSPTEREFDLATATRKERIVLLKGQDDATRHPKMKALVQKAGAQVIRRRFNSVPELTAALYASLVEYLARTGALRSRPFDASACLDATLDD